MASGRAECRGVGGLEENGDSAGDMLGQNRLGQLHICPRTTKHLAKTNTKCLQDFLVANLSSD